MKIKLAVVNTEESIKEYNKEQRRLTIHCRSCRRTYRATLEEQMDKPGCPWCEY